MLAGRLGGSRFGLGDLLARITAAPLVPVHTQRQLVEARPHLLESRFGLVQIVAPRLDAGFLVLEGESRCVLALALGGDAAGEVLGLGHEGDVPQAEQHPIDARQLLAGGAVATGLARLTLEALELLLHLVNDVVHAEEVLLGRVELDLGLLPACLVLGDAGRFFDQGAPIGGLARQDETDLALLDDGVGLGAEAGVHEQLVDVPQAADVAVHEVLALAAAVEATGDRGLWRIVRARHLQPGDLQVHLGHLQGLTCLAAVEDHVFHGRPAEALGALLAQHPRDGVGDVALPTAVGADDTRHAPFERDLLPVAEALESDDLD